jgi:cobalt-zinc-cadmium efflux system outer membrane protein
VAALRAEEDAATGKLAALLGLPANETLTVQDIPPLPSSLPAAASPANRPDIRLAEIAIEAAEKDLGLARAMRWEDIGVGVFVEAERFRDEPEGIEPEGLIGMRLSLPLPVWNNGQAAVEERKAIAQRRTELLEAIRLAAAHEAASAWRQMKARFSAAQQMQNDALPAARKLLADTQAASDRGEADVQRIFRVRERLIAIENDALESRSQFHLARAAWLHAAGAPTP